MKKFINGKWFPLVIVVVVEAVLLVFLYCNNFRITYAPDLENSWDAVSTFAAWTGVLMSFVAIMTAIWTPQKIANRQDKIALFEKRMECYCTLQNILAFAQQISELKSKQGIQTALKLYFGEAASFSENQDFPWYIIALNRQVPIIAEGMFLFPEYEEEIPPNLLLDIIELSELVAVKTREDAEQPISDSVQTCKENICNMCSRLETTLIPLMEKELQLYVR